MMLIEYLRPENFHTLAGVLGEWVGVALVVFYVRELAVEVLPWPMTVIMSFGLGFVLSAIWLCVWDTFMVYLNIPF